ncbi:hypothetical protein ACUN24_17185 [Pedobacter sp. WC2501]|uniref:hypothetical protein n=1 Tax=Pedobacter sp. WC2501 TaxID=3461400 RepID=UPI0040457ACB
MKKINLLFGLLLCLAACREEKTKVAVSQSDTLLKKADKNVKDPVKAITGYISVETWIDDFKNFRQAVYIKDKAKLKTYFNFPVVADENSSLWFVVQLSEKEWQKRKAKYAQAELFYEEDFDLYFDKIFNADFSKTLMKIKTDKLFNNHHSESPVFTLKGYTYQMLADVQPADNVLQLNMSYGNNGVDENGEKVSEGEYNNIYMFNIVDGKTILFKGLTVAG